MPKFIPGTTIPHYSCTDSYLGTKQEDKEHKKNKISICTKAGKGDETRKNILNKIIAYIAEHGYAPSVREICELTGLRSTSTVHRHLNIMLKKGMIETDSPEGSPRAIRVPHYKFVKEEE